MSETEIHVEQENISNNGSYVRIEEDQMIAWLFLAETDISYTKDEIYEFLEQQGVIKGYHVSNIAGMAKKRVYGREIKVAMGKTNESGQDGYFEYTFLPESYTAPKVLEDGSVDYTSMKTLHTVYVGDEVAIYHPAVQGENGYTVTGIVLRAREAKNLSYASGMGVEVDMETGVYRAVIDGKAEVVNHRVDIRSVHEVKGDVDLLTGAIDFIGDVIIWGNVEAGVSIKSDRNIEIHGSVEAADLTAGGDIILTRGIQGAQKSKIVSKGNVFADFIEHTTVEAEGNVRANSILNSNVSSNGKVTLTGKGRRGAIIGGNTHGLQGVEAATIGNDVEVRTMVHAGYPPEDQKRYYTCKKSEGNIEQELSKVTESLDGLQKSQMANSDVNNPVLEQRIKELKKQQEKCYEELTKIRRSMADLDQTMKMGKDAKIVIDGNIYKGAIIGVDSHQIVVEHNTCYMRYFSQGGKMESNVIIN